MWQSVKISDIATILTGNTPSTKNEAFYGGLIPFIKPPDLTNDEIISSSNFLTEQGRKKSRTAPKHSTLVCCIGSIGKTGYTTQEVAFNQQINAVIPNKDINSQFVFYFTQTEKFQNELIAKSNVTTLPIINKSTFSELYLSLPTRQEQDNIAIILTNLKQKIKSVNKKIELYKQLKQSLIEKLFMEGLYRENKKSTELGDLPNSWEVENFEKLKIELIDGDRSSNYPSGDDVLSTGNIIFLSTKNIEKERFVFQDKRFISEEKYKKLRKGQLQEGDIVITVRGTLGNVALFKDLEYKKGFINAQMLIIRNLSEFIDTEYLAFYLTTPIFQQQIIANRSGSAQYQIPKGTLSKLLLLIPPKKEQREITNILRICNQKILNLETQIKKTTKLFNSLLSQLMNNEIDVSNLELENA